jgi:hypothetical protein
MSEITAAAEPKVMQVGPDRVTIKENEVIIEAKHRMEDWKVREINPWPVYFDDKKYNLIQCRKAEKPYEAAYVLVPWSSGLSTTAKGFYTYDLDAVAERTAARRTGQMDDAGKAFLLPLYPFLGLTWSGMQQRLSRFGFVPHAITGLSIFIVFALIFAQGVFAIVSINGSLRSGKLMVGGFLRAMSGHDYLHLGSVSVPIGLLDCLLVLVMMADVAFRYTYYLREHDWAGGFLEWVVNRPGVVSKADTAD